MLQAQLTASASLNAALLSRGTTKKSSTTSSYLFSAKDANTLDADAIFHLAKAAFAVHAAIRRSIQAFEEPLFSQAAKAINRTQLTVAENKRLDEVIGRCLLVLSQDLLESSASKLIEWLVRHFRIHEFNVDQILDAFMPYHETPNFIKMLAIVHLDPSSPWSFLLVLKEALTPLYIHDLVTEMAANQRLARIVISILQRHIQANSVHRVAIGFHMSVTAGYLRRIKLTDVHLAFILPCLIEGVTKTRIKDCVLANVLLLASISQQTNLSSDAIEAILCSITEMMVKLERRQFLLSISSILSPQDPLSTLPEPVLVRLLLIPDLVDTLLSSSWPHVEKLLQPLISSLTERGPTSSDPAALRQLLISPNLSSELLEHGCSALVASIFGGNEDGPLQELLSELYQRHPVEVRTAIREYAEENEDDGSDEDDLIASLSLSKLSLGDSVQDFIVMSTHHEPSVRAQGVRGLLSASPAALEERESVKSTLTARFSDPEVIVLVALYEPPTRLLDLIPTGDCISAMMTVLQSGDLKADSLEQHVKFLSCLPNGSMDVLKLLFPYMLASKSTIKHAEVVWVGLSQLTVSLAPELKKLWTEHFQGGKAQKHDMANFNGDLANHLARAYLEGSRLEDGLDFLVEQLGAPSRVSQTLSLLVVYSLVTSADGVNLLKIATTVLKALEDTNVEALGYALGTNFKEALELGHLLKLSASKSGSKSTLRTIKAAVLSVLTGVPSRVSSSRNWLASDPPEDAHGLDIVQFSRRLYKLLNSSASMTNPFAPFILRSLLLSIGEDCLLFFAGVWSDPTFGNLRFVALRHGQAFVQAHVDSQSKRATKDFQIVWPFILAVLTEENQEIRGAASSFVEILYAGVKIDEGNKKVASPDIYGLDRLPVEVKNSLKFLEWPDFVKLVATVAAWAEHLTVDAVYLTDLLESTLQVRPGESGKNAKYKRRLLSYLLSHVVAWFDSCPLLPVKILQEIHDVTDSMKLRVLLPLLDALAKSPSNVLGRLSFNHRESYVVGLLSSFHGKEVGSYMNADSSEEWETLKELARIGLKDNSTEMSHLLPAAILSVYDVLKQSRRVELCQHLISIGEEADTTTAIREVLVKMTEDSSVASSILAWVLGSANGAAERPAKRARLDREPPSLTALPLICEALVASEVSRPMGILAALLDALNLTLDGHLEKGETVFLQCTIMKTVDNLAMRVPSQAPGGSQLRIDVLVKLAQDSENPQAIHQALLLIAALAAMSPLSVLHHVMPILNSTGTHICPRDDAYSSKVVEKTLDSIIPVLVEDLRSRHQPSALQIAAKPFLNIFVDIAPDIPLHRRRPFFLHLLHAFGSREFLAPICVLLLQPHRDFGSSGEPLMNLALAIAKSETSDSQLLAYISILSECLQILSKTADMEDNFVASSGAEGDQSNEGQLERIGVLLTFVQRGLRRLRASAVDELMTQGVLDLLLKLGHHAPPEPHVIKASISDAIEDALDLMPVRGMMELTVTRIEWDDQSLQNGSLDLVARRLGRASTAARKEVNSSIISVIIFIEKLLMSSPTDNEGHLLRESALGALVTISATALPDELPTLSKTVSVVAHYLNHNWNTLTGLAALITLCKTLGTRVIPDLKKILSALRSVIQRSPMDEGKVGDAVGLLNQLLETHSNFWSSADVVPLLSLCGRQHDSPLAASHLHPFAKRLARQLPAETMLKAIKQHWAELKEGDDDRERRSDRLFVVVREWIKSHQRPQVEGAARDLFKMLLEAWDIVAVAPESSSVRAFVTMTAKLSDITFRPFHRKMFDWAWGSQAEKKSAVHRKFAYFTSMTTLLTVLKGLITPYLAPLVDPMMELLDVWSKQGHVDSELWAYLIRFLTLSFEVDEGAFWREDLIRKLSKPLIQQISVAATLDDLSAKDDISCCVSSMVGIVLDDGLLKQINLDILMQTREDEVRTTLYALGCAHRIWEDHGERLAGLQTEALPFVHDCADDTHDEVVREARRLKVVLDRF